MTLQEIVERAKQEPTIADALAVACIIENERILKSYRPGEVFETCFKRVIETVLESYYDDGVPDLTHYRSDKKVREKMTEVTGLLNELLSR
jgi:hypothetical protein